MGTKLLSRNDDFGSSRAANKAILEAVACGYITRNVSCMAPAPYIAEGAEALKKFRHIDIGMHATITSEWEGIRWGALTDNMKNAAFTCADGTFFRTQQELVATGIDVEIILKEYDAQLDLLTKLGLSVSYVDSHMFPEYFFDELYDALIDWTKRKGLICAEEYYRVADPIWPVPKEDTDEFLDDVEQWLGALPAGGQYMYLTHPACPTDETLLMYADGAPKGKIRMERGAEYRAVTSPRWEQWIRTYDLTPVRYSEAQKQGMGNLKKILTGD